MLVGRFGSRLIGSGIRAGAATGTGQNVAMDESLSPTLEVLSDRSMPGFRRRGLGDWVLRAALGATGRANSVWPTGEPGVPVEEAVDQVEDWYAALGLAPVFQLFDGADPGLVAELDLRGYADREGALVMTGEIRRLSLPPGPTGVRAVLEAEAPPHHRVLMGDDVRLAELTAADLERRFVTVVDGENGLLGGGVAVLDGPWVGVFAMKTLPGARRRGVASRVLAEIGGWALASGADRMWLQVMGSNAGARALYRRVGLVESHSYGYRRAGD